MLDLNVNAQRINAGRARSMDLITTALFELLEETPFAQISVTDICVKAGVARKTFYRNFESKISVVERLFDQVFFEFMQKYDFKTSGARKIYLYWYEYILCTREFTLIFFDPDLYVFITDKIREFVEIELSETLHNSASFDPMLSNYYLNFAAAGIASIMREWMKNDCQIPAAIMASVTTRLLSGVLM
ncbi:MAG: TetR/AcrR family transcriptional regulator C-terminal domain-containing protein [Clostridiales bacterium]|nr:TetR/AcrR family transcriptional regulator C-terminal domain-containing protein [Clostridiales bacterium]